MAEHIINSVGEALVINHGGGFFQITSKDIDKLDFRYIPQGASLECPFPAGGYFAEGKVICKVSQGVSAIGFEPIRVFFTE